MSEAYGSLKEIKERMLVYEIQCWVGFTELGGDNKGQVVEMFQKSVGGRAVSQSWCLDFVQWCVKKVDSIYDIIFLQSSIQTNLLNTEHCMTLFRFAKEKNLLVPTPYPGCLVIWQHYNKDNKPTDLGHVGIVISDLHQDKEHFNTVEGNTGPGSGVEREGDGVFAKTRSINPTGSMKIMGFVRVW